MVKLINAPYAKQQDTTGQSLVTICLGTQAHTIAKHFNEMGKSAVEIELENTLGEQGKSYPCVVVDSEILDNIERYRIAPKNTQSIRLIQANNGIALSNETLERIYLNIVQTTSAENVIYCNEDIFNGYAMGKPITGKLSQFANLSEITTSPTQKNARRTA